MKKTFFISILFIIALTNCKKVGKGNFTYLNSIFVNTKLNDTISGIFILDTGSPITILDSSFIAENKIKLDSLDQIMLGGSGNSKLISTTVYKNIPIKTLGKLINSDIILIYNLKKIIPIEDGIIGINFFKKRIVMVDYLKQKITFPDNIENIDKSYKKIPLIIKNDHLYIKLKVKVNDSILVEGLFLIDTGSEFAIQFDSYISDSLNLFNKIEKKITKNINNGGIGGTTLKFLIKGQKANFSDFEIKNILISCSQNKNGAEKYFKKQRKGTLGNLFFDKFDLIFDVDESFLYIRPNVNYYKKFEYNRAGISLGQITSSNILIKSIWDIPTLKNKNILKGDILTEIDNKKIKNIGYFKTRRLLQKRGKHKLSIIRNKKTIQETIDVYNLMNLL